MSEIQFKNKYVVIIILELKRVPYPILDLNISSINSNQPFITAVAALPGSQAVLISYVIDGIRIKNQVLKVNKHGQFVQTLYTCVRCIIEGVLVLGDNLYIVHQVGKIIKVNPTSTEIVQEYKMNPRLYMANKGPLYFDPDLIPDKDLLIITSPSHQEVFTYRLSTQMKESSIKIGVQVTNSITYSFYNNQTHYVVAFQSNSSVNVYDSKWHFVRTFGGKNGQLGRPRSVIASPEGTVIVGDSSNGRVSEFSMEGEFLCHLLVKSDGISTIQALSFSYPHLWILQVRDNKLTRYILYDDK